MSAAVKFILRAALSLLLAWFIARTFWKLTDWLWVILLAVFMLGMSYLAEGMRRRRDDDS